MNIFTIYSNMKKWDTCNLKEKKKLEESEACRLFLSSCVNVENNYKLTAFLKKYLSN